jgi:hypothetical protein
MPRLLPSSITVDAPAVSYFFLNYLRGYNNYLKAKLMDCKWIFEVGVFLNFYLQARRSTTAPRPMTWRTACASRFSLSSSRFLRQPLLRSSRRLSLSSDKQLAGNDVYQICWFGLQRLNCNQ